MKRVDISNLGLLVTTPTRANSNKDGKNLFLSDQVATITVMLNLTSIVYKGCICSLILLHTNLLLASPKYDIKDSSKKDCISNYIDFKYSILTKNSLKYSKLDIDPENIIFSKDDSNVTFLEMIDLNNKIFLKTFKYCDKFPPYKYRCKISILGFSYNIDSLLFGQDYSDSSAPILASLLTEYIFDFQDKRYIALFISDECVNSSRANYMVLLFDITDKKNVIPITIPFQGSDDINCISDFNNDGNLDFAYLLDGMSGKLTFFTLKNNHFVKDDRYFVVVKTIDGVLKIDTCKSNWFFNF